MTLNEVCRKRQAHCLKIPLKSTEQVYLLFLIPAFINCAIYILHFSADLVVAEQHFREGNSVWAWCTIALLYTPATVYFVLTISRSDWWMTDEDKATKGMYLWFGLQVCQLVAFPIFSLYRYAGLMVLAIDALFLTGNVRVKTLNAAAAPAAIELYLFLRAWFQAIPQALLQTHLFFRESHIQRSHQSETVQILSILMSVVVAAKEATSFQRFESQRVNGRTLPWAMWFHKYSSQELRNVDEAAPLQLSITADVRKGQRHCSGIVAAGTPSSSPKRTERAINDEASREERRNDKTEHNAPLNRQISITPPLPPKNVRLVAPPTPLRGITTVAPLPIPDEHAPPRPDSIVRSSVNNSNDTVQGNEQSVLEGTDEPIADNGNPMSSDAEQTLRVPQRRYSTKGLEEDDPIGIILSFLWWFFFILARALSVAVFYEFYPIHLAALLAIHYVITLAYLFYYSTPYRDPVACAVNLWLGLIYIFCAIEYRIKFKYADKYLLPYYAFVMLQNTAITLTWFFTDWEGFWYVYVFCAIFISMVLSILSAAVYNLLLKPKKCRVYNGNG